MDGEPKAHGDSNRVSARSGRAAAAGPVRVEEFAARLVNPYVGMSAEIIALGLEQVRREHRGALLIVKRQGGAERRNGNAALHRGSHDIAPAVLAALDFTAEIIVRQHV